MKSLTNYWWQETRIWLNYIYDNQNLLIVLAEGQLSKNWHKNSKIENNFFPNNQETTLFFNEYIIKETNSKIYQNQQKF